MICVGRGDERSSKLGDRLKWLPGPPIAPSDFIFIEAVAGSEAA